MSFPYLFSENFDLGTLGIFNSESDSSTILDYPHYTELARNAMAPYGGAYAMRIRPAGGTTSAYVQENDGFDTAAAGTIFIRFYVYVGQDLQMGASDKFSIFEAESVADTTTEFACGFDQNSGNLRFWMAETIAASASTLTLGTLAQARGKWYCIELKALIDDGAGNNGTLDGWVNGTPLTQITALDQGAIVDAKLGIIGLDAGTIGTLLFDSVVADDTRLHPLKDRFTGTNHWAHAAQDFPLIGPGKFSAAITGTGTNAVLSIYDTDRALTDETPIAVLRNLTANEFIPGHDIFEVKHGAFITQTGTNVQSFFSIDRGGILSDGAYINAGRKGGFK